MAFELSANVEVHRDADGRVRTLRHPQDPFSAEAAGLTEPSPQELADEYVREVAPLYGIDVGQLADLSREALAEPSPQGTQLRRPEVKTVQNITVVSYPQTHLGLPVWQAALEVRLYGEPLRAVSSASTLDPDVEVEAPPSEAFGRFTGDDRQELAEALGLDDDAAQRLVINGTRMLVYRYDPAQRLDPAITLQPGGQVQRGSLPILPLPPVPEGIEPGRHYVVREVLFTLPLPDWGDLHWRALIEPETGGVLYLRAFVASATACVFVTDPITSGNAVDACSPAADLDPLRATVTLQGLDVPDAGGNQALAGEFVALADTDPLNIAPPTTTTPFSFCYSAVTDDFTAASAYHHYDFAYRTLQGMGFDIDVYFDGTTFPVPVDHQGVGNAVNAFAIGNATDTGMEKFINGFAQAGCPVGIATDVRLIWHEFGHALLYDHVASPNFGWCHSAGDTLGVINCDPGSLAPDRFLTFPWIPAIVRRHDRDVTLGWAWGGLRDDTQYNSEQILSTLLFRVYRTTGGDDADINIQRFAARYLTYLIVQAIGTLTVTTTDPVVFETAMEDADNSTPDFEGHPGGAWHKVIRWSFEQQGLFQPPTAPTPVAQPGAPPPVDVYIDDGRNGGYMPYLPNFAATADIWNRRAPDGGTTHEEPELNRTNHVYARVRNRGTQDANGVTVRLYQGDPGGGLAWPAGYQAVTTPQLPVAGPLVPGGQAVVGPFTWTPQVAGHEALLASVSAPGDLSNADTVNGPIPDWRLVPFDNNLARRDVAPVLPAAQPSSGFAIQGTLGEKGNFEAVRPLLDGRLAHFWRDNDAPNLRWRGPHRFGPTDVYEAVALIQGNISTVGGGPGNLEIVVRRGDRLVHFWRDDVSPFPWHVSVEIPGSSGASGIPALIQGRFGARGNFEVVTPLASGGLAHLWRDNDDLANLPWHRSTRFGSTIAYDAVALVQSNFSTAGAGPGNLEVVAHTSHGLVHYWRDDVSPFPWHISTDIPGSNDISGPPALIQGRFGTRGNFEVVAPLAGGGLAHLWRDNDAANLPWHRSTRFGSGDAYHAVALIQSNFSTAGGGPGNLEVIAQTGGRLHHYWRDDVNPFPWHGPVVIPRATRLGPAPPV
ncbi:MAG TPA: hypothetical protein VHO93_06915 [Actinomycetota bacterium]|nr:hypothetical protein [Actinomycetota bacterium]